MKTIFHLFLFSLLTKFAHAQNSDPPMITSISVTPSVDITSSEQTVTATVEISANDLDFEFGNLFLYRPDGNFVSSHAMGSSQRTAGDRTEGTYEVEMTIPQYAPAGTWEIRGFVEDSEGNQRDYGGGNEPFPVPGDATFTVVNTGTVDTTGPALVSLSVTPGSIDTGTISQSIQVTLNLTDALSGVRTASLSLRDPESAQKFGISGFVFFTQITSGDIQDGVFTINSNIPQGSLDGTWTFDVSLTDQVGNRVTISEPAGASFVVSNTPANALGDLSDATDATQYSWSTSEFQGWFPQSTETEDGIDAAQTGAISDSGNSDLEIMLTGPGTLDFFWKVDSEEARDFLAVEVVGGDDFNAITGNVDWTSASVSIPPGPQTVRFRYEKDESGSEGADAGWIDKVCFTADTDSEAPVIQRLSISPNPVNISSGLTEVTVTLEISDDANGFSDGDITLTEVNSNNEYATLSFDSSDLVSGDSKFGTYEITFEFYPEDFDPEQGGYQDGTYRISAEIYEQVSGNSRLYGNGEDEFPIPTLEFFTVGGAPTGSAPFLTSISSRTPETVNVSSGDQLVTFEFGVSSNTIGFAFGDISLFNPSGNFVKSISFDSTDLISGDDTNGTYSVTLPIYQHSAPGIWNANFYLSDYDDNARSYPDETDFPNPGAEVFTVINTGTVDTTDPVLTSFVMSETVVDTSSGPQSITVDFAITDDLSGIESVSLYAYDPNGNFVGSLFTSFPTSGLLSDSYSGTFDLPMGSQEGTWNSVLSVRDRTGNSFFYVSGSLGFGSPFPGPVTGQFTVGPVAETSFGTFISAFSLTGMDALPGGNPDGDLFNNALEFLIGLNPTTPNFPNPAIYEELRVGNEIRINFTIDPALTVVTSGDFLELSTNGNPPIRVTGQTGTTLQNDWINQLPVNLSGTSYRVTLPITTPGTGMMRLRFTNP